MTTGMTLIVGAGITGVCVAEWLRRDGWSVMLIDPVTARRAPFATI
jgi:2-polyprenyl-6-methoxyphenol hydroxylase-like FAD-dependent oxidoreductase